ncbi:MAG: hypothetical protein FJ126_13640 [Deltaproteobacteria bacterium]|nr:hypothetical protein [Deltaproteobacteria bacterium]
MKKLAILVAVFLFMCSSALAAAPPLVGKTYRGTGYGVESGPYFSMTITVKITSQSTYRFKGTVTTSRGGGTDPPQKFYAVISATNQIYMVVQESTTTSEAANVVVDAKYNVAVNTITGFWRSLTHAGAGLFTLKQVS